ncbi:hypothetical protein TcasGA2_TC008193 [Tribolium castaneum]|uniref:Uncharacterized protein n=1 Tax=Tribolium castaneum TaxID=7070 RepID=D2A0C9_TRICA|nr:hypothetical protein TcasGA2_TC008193 [Tribolium castaneum]
MTVNRHAISVDDHEECHDVTHLNRASCRIVTVNTPKGTVQFTTYDSTDISELAPLATL